MASSDKPSLGRSALQAMAAEVAAKLIRAYRSENGLWDLFRNKTGAVTVTTMDGIDIFGSNSTSPTYLAVDRAEADQMRANVLQKYPNVFQSENMGQMPRNAFYHAEANVLMRAARQNNLSLSGRTLEVFGDRQLCNNCEKILPFVGLELGNPAVTFVNPDGRRLKMRDGIWLEEGAP